MLCTGLKEALLVRALDEVKPVNNTDDELRAKFLPRLCTCNPFFGIDVRAFDSTVE